MNQILQKKPLTIFGDGNQTRAFSYIGDVAPYIARSVKVKEAYGEIFNIGADQEYSINDLAKTIMKVMGSSVELRYLPQRNEVLHAYADHSKAKKLFSISHYTPLEDGVSRMVDWVKRVGARKTPFFQDIEIKENIPLVWLEG